MLQYASACARDCSGSLLHWQCNFCLLADADHRKHTHNFTKIHWQKTTTSEKRDKAP